MGRYSQRGARLFPSLYLDVDVAAHPFGSSSQCSLQQLSSAETSL